MPVANRRADVVAATHAAQPVGQQARDVRRHAVHARIQRVGRVRRGALRLARPLVDGDARRSALPAAPRIVPVAGDVEAGQLDGIQALPQHGLERILPSGLDVEALPEPASVGETLVVEPARAVLALSDLRLQRGKGFGARRDVGERGSRLLRGVARRALPLLKLLHRIAQRVQPRLARGKLRGFLAMLVLDGGDLPGHRCGETGELAVEALAALLQLRLHAAEILAPGFDHADRLLGEPDLALDLGEERGFVGDRALEDRQRGARRLLLRTGLLARRHRLLDRRLGGAAIGEERRVLAGERADLLGELRDLLRDPRLALARERELLLEARHLGVRFVERRLLLVHGVAGRVVLAAQRFLLRFGGANLRLHGVERHGERRDRRAVTLARVRGILLLREPQQVLDLLQPRLEVAILGRDLRLRVELLELAAELDPDVLDAREILPRVGKPAFGLLAPLLVLRDARRLLEEHAQLFRLRLDHARDHSLLDDRVGAGAETGAEEKIVDVAAAHRDVVDVIGRVAVARQHALDRELGVLTPLAADPAGAVVEEELDRSAADGLALARAVEDHVLHRLAAQRGGLRFAEHPAHGVDHVRLAASVRADDADEPARRREHRRIDKRLEPGELDLGEAQRGYPGKRAAGSSLCGRAERGDLAAAAPMPQKR